MITPFLKKIDGDFYTLNLTPGREVYGEKRVIIDGKEWRRWDPFRSKLCAALHNGLRRFVFEDGKKVLYLGASTGTTISHISDLMPHGEIYAVEISAVMMKELVKLAEFRENIVPILADARKPKEYEEIGTVDVLYQDVAQPDQAEILVKNAKMFLKKGGYSYFCVKSQSVDVLKEPKKVFDEVVDHLERAGLCVEERLTLEPFDKAHEFLVVKNE